MDDFWQNDQVAHPQQDDNWWNADKAVGHSDPNYSLLSAIRGGAGDVLQGASKTMDVLGGQGTASDTLSSLGKSVAPGQGVDSPTAVLMDSKRPLWDRIKAAPYALAENSPGIATDLAAGEAGAATGGSLGALGGPLAEVTVPAGAALGGLLGFGGSYFARNFGNSVQRSADSRGGGSTVQPNTEDYIRGAADTALGAALSRVGLKGALGTTADLAGDTVGSLLPQAAKGIAKGAAIDAATSGAQNAADQAILDRKVDPDQVAASAALGGLTGGGLAGLKVPAEVNQRIKFADIEPQFGNRVANRFDGLDTSTPSKSFEAVDKVNNDLNTEIKTRSSEANPVIQAHVEDSGFTSDIPEQLNKIKTTLKSGDTVSDDDLQPLRSAIGGTREGARLIESLEDQNTLNQIKKVGNYDTSSESFGGGITGSKFGQTVLNPMGKLGRWGDAGLLAEGALGVHLPGQYAFHILDPSTSAMLVGAHVGTYGLSKGIDKFLGNENPLGGFVNRFGSDNQSYPSENLPSYRQGLVEQQAQKQAQADLSTKLKAEGARAKLMQNSAKLEQQQNAQAQKQAQDELNQKLTAARYTSGLMKADELRQQREAAQAAKVPRVAVADQENSVIPGMTNGEVSSAKRAIQAIGKKENLRQKSLDQQLSNARQTSRLMQNSEQGPVSDATTAIRLAKLKEQYAKQNAQTEENGQGPQGGNGRGQGRPKGNGSQESQSSSQEAPRQSTVTIRAGGDAVERSVEGVRNLARYTAAVQSRMEARGKAVDAVKAAVPQEYHKTLEHLRRDLNRQEGMSRVDAYHRIEDVVNSLPEKYQGHAMDHLASDAVLTTFRER